MKNEVSDASLPRAKRGGRFNPSGRLTDKERAEKRKLEEEAYAALCGPVTVRSVEKCSTCGQPDNCGDCDHTPLTDEEKEKLR